MSRSLFAPAMFLAAFTLLPAASITSVQRFVSATGEAVDHHPENADADANREASTSTGAFDQNVGAETQANDNFGSSSGTQHSTLNLTTRQFSGGGNASAETDTEFNQADFLEESFLDARGQSQFEFTFTIARSGRVRLESFLAANSKGHINVSSARASVWIVNTATGATVWTSTVTQGATSFNGEIPLKKGAYRFGVLADVMMADSGFTANTASGTASFRVTGQVIE